MSSQGTGAQRAYRIITVTIKPGDPPTVDPFEVHVSKKRKDEVIWESNGAPFVVRFDAETPFDSDRFDHAQSRSGPVRGNAEEKRYKYTVETGGGIVDPDTIVDQ